MALNTSFRLYQALFVFLIVSLWVVISVAAIEHFNWYSVFLSGLLIHAGIIFICIACSSWVLKTIKISLLCEALSLKKTNSWYFIIALILAIIIWVADFWLHLFLFLDDGKGDSLQIQNDIKNFGAIALIFTVCFLAPLAEELLFRGILLKGLMNSLNPRWSILISSILFAAIHFSANDFLTLFIAASVYACLTIKSKSLFPAIFAHFINNSVTAYYLLTLSI